MNPQETPSPQPPQPQSPVSPQPPEPTIKNPLAVMQPGERVICEVKRHPMGLLSTYISGVLLVLIAAGLAVFVAPQVANGDNHGKILLLVTVGLIVIAGFTFLIMLVARTVYWSNRWVLTSDSVTDVTRVGLFDKHVSQLSLANLEDVTFEQDGIMAHLFNYGTLRAETAGEHTRFRLSYCANPTHYAQCILQAREDFEQKNYRVNSAPVDGVYPSQPPQA